MYQLDTLAKRVKYRRKELGLSQEQVAAESGLKQPDVSKIELGHILKTTGLAGLARALQCNVDWLDTGDGPMTGPLVVREPSATYFDQLSNLASPKSREVINKLTVLARLNKLRDEDWAVLDQMADRLGVK